MAKFNCKCGNVIRVSGDIPNPAEWHLISDTEYDAVFESNIELEKLYSKGKLAFICNQCNRIWIYWNGLEKEPSSYLLENDGS